MEGVLGVVGETLSVFVHPPDEELPEERLSEERDERVEVSSTGLFQ